MHRRVARAAHVLCLAVHRPATFIAAFRPPFHVSRTVRDAEERPNACPSSQAPAVLAGTRGSSSSYSSSCAPRPPSTYNSVDSVLSAATETRPASGPRDADQGTVNAPCCTCLEQFSTHTQAGTCDGVPPCAGTAADGRSVWERRWGAAFRGFGLRTSLEVPRHQVPLKNEQPGARHQTVTFWAHR